MKAAEAEIENAVREAYAEGYKAAMLQYTPELAALKIKEASLMEKLERERKKSLYLLPAAGASFAAGVLLHGLLTR